MVTTSTSTITTRCRSIHAGAGADLGGYGVAGFLTFR
jgi:hypothetical protein